MSWRGLLGHIMAWNVFLVLMWLNLPRRESEWLGLAGGDGSAYVWAFVSFRGYSWFFVACRAFLGLVCLLWPFPCPFVNLHGSAWLFFVCGFFSWLGVASGAGTRRGACISVGIIHSLIWLSGRWRGSFEANAGLRRGGGGRGGRITQALKGAYRGEPHYPPLPPSLSLSLPLVSFSLYLQYHLFSPYSSTFTFHSTCKNVPLSHSPTFPHPYFSLLFVYTHTTTQTSSSSSCSSSPPPPA